MTHASHPIRCRVLGDYEPSNERVRVCQLKGNRFYLQATLETTKGEIDGLLGQLKYYLPEVASVEDWLKICPQLDSRVVPFAARREQRYVPQRIQSSSERVRVSSHLAKVCVFFEPSSERVRVLTSNLARGCVFVLVRYHSPRGASSVMSPDAFCLALLRAVQRKGACWAT